MIINESDERQFRDLQEFYNQTRSDSVFTICLTATPYGGEDDGLESTVLDEMGYKIYCNSAVKEDFVPVIHESIEIGAFEK